MPPHPRHRSPEPDLLRRRTFAGAAVAATVASALPAGCAHPLASHGRIVDLSTGGTLTTAQLLPLLRASDFVLLGEHHDHALHHRLRGALLAALGPDAVVVAEQLQRGRQVGPGSALLARLRQAGFDPTAWMWPLHEALFRPLLDAGLALHGGNASGDLVRRVAREGRSAWPEDLRDLIDAAPLDDAAQRALDLELEAGHCAQLPAARVPPMRAAQRLRDASLLRAMLDLPGRPTVLVAGNGHVRTDHGVPQLLRVARPRARWVAVGFVEGQPGPQPQPYTHVWLTPTLRRVDPCAGFRMPAPGASSVQRTV